MHPAVTTFAAESSSGLGALGVDGKAFVIQLITFVLAFLVLRRYAFGPILKVLNERKVAIENGVKLGEQMQKEKIELEASVAEQLHEARKQADAVLAAAHDDAKLTVREAEAKAKVKADAIVAEAHERTLQDIARARKQLEQEMVSLISDATEAIIDEKVDAKKDAALIDRALKGQVAA
jgi:F-type H+-transporting ATPase subunit b